MGDASLQYTIVDNEGAEDDGVVSVTVDEQQPATLLGTQDSDLIFGSQTAETIDSLGSADDVFARGGDDLILAGDGGYLVDGGAGFDTVDFFGSNIGVRADIEARIGQGGFAQGMNTSVLRR